jgi:hypothetical protein
MSWSLTPSPPSVAVWVLFAKLIVFQVGMGYSVSPSLPSCSFCVLLGCLIVGQLGIVPLLLSGAFCVLQYSID